MYCPEWMLSAHSSIDTSVVIFGTLATVSCDDGYMFPDGSNRVTVECTTDNQLYSTAVWNVTDLICQGEFPTQQLYVNMKDGDLCEQNVFT
jgi:uncharacterized protein YdeI (BOF family)